jgi:hypothetical protein
MAAATPTPPIVSIPADVLADLGNAALGVATHHPDPIGRLRECFEIARLAIEAAEAQA